MHGTITEFEGDKGNWGDILNDSLKQAHAEHGTLATNTVVAPQLKPQSVSEDTLADGSLSASKLSPKVPMIRRCRLIESPPRWKGRRFEFALLLDPDPHVGERVLQMLAEAIRARSQAAGAPVVDRGDGNAQVVGRTRRRRAAAPGPGVARRAVFGVHTEEVRRAPTHESGQPARRDGYRNAAARESRKGVKVMGFR